MFSSICIISVVVFGFSATGELSATGEHQLPFVNVCKRNSTNYFNCLKHEAQKVLPQLIKGIPDFDIPPLDPLTYELNKLVIDIGIAHGEIKISNFTFKGLRKNHFVAVKAYFLDNDFRLEISGQFPKLAGTGKCDVVGFLGGLRLHANGRFKISLEDVQGTLILKGHVTNDTGTIEDCYVAPSVKKMQMYFEDLFNGNKEFNDLAMTIANEYWPSLYRNIIPSIVKDWCLWFNDIANPILLKLSFSKLFP